MRIIKLMVDYQCYPLWEASSGKVGNINPESLPISKALRCKLIRWAKIFDATLNLNDPARSGFSSAESESQFKRVGNKLGERLRGELGSDFLVEIKI